MTNRGMLVYETIKLGRGQHPTAQSEDETGRTLVSVSHLCLNAPISRDTRRRAVSGNTLKGETLRLASEVAIEPR
jgi:hypothetical protein